MLFLVAALIIMAAYQILRRDETALKQADRIFYLGAGIVVLGVIMLVVQLYLNAKK